MFDGYRVSFGDDRDILEVDGSDVLPQGDTGR